MSDGAAAPAAGAEAAEVRAVRWRIVLARVLTIAGILLLVVSVLANFVKRSALDSSQFRDTSRALIADRTIRDQLALTIVDQLYANVNVSSELQNRLPKNMKGLAGPIAGAAREGSDQAARTLLARPRVQDAFVTAAALAQRQFVAVLDGDTRVLDTTGGKVLLDLRPLVLRLGERFSFIPNLDQKVPPGRAQITILQSDQLKSAQNLTKALRFTADWIWVFALGAWAVAIWLARGRRRIELRAMAIGVIVAGFVVLVVRTLAGRYFVDHLVKSDSVKPAAANAFDILTGLLRGAGWTAVIVGVVGLVGVWLAGPGRRATSARRSLAPYLRRPEIAYGALLLGYLLLLWWKPTPQFSFVLDVVVFLALALLGLEALRRMTAREHPDVQHAEVVAALLGAVAALRPSRPAGTPSTSEELERLGRLHAEGVIDDAEFAAAKASLLGTRVPTSD